MCNKISKKHKPRKVPTKSDLNNNLIIKNLS